MVGKPLSNELQILNVLFLSIFGNLMGKHSLQVNIAKAVYSLIFSTVELRREKFSKIRSPGLSKAGILEH